MFDGMAQLFDSIPLEYTTHVGQATLDFGGHAEVIDVVAGPTPVFRVSGSGGDTSGATSASCGYDIVIGDLMIVFVIASGNTNTAPTCDDDAGGTYTLIDTAAWGAGANMLSLFVRNSIVASSVFVTITATVGANTAMELGAVSFTGMTRVGADAISQFTILENQTAATTPTPVFTAAVGTASTTITCLASTAVTLPTPTLWTEVVYTGEPTPNTFMSIAERESGFTGTSLAYGGTCSLAYSVIALELKSTVTTITPATRGSNIATIAVAAQHAITDLSHVEAWMMMDSTATHNAYEHSMVPIRLTCGTLWAGHGFTITGVSDWLLTGTFTVRWGWL